MNVVAIIQARMGSTRLPGKVLLDLAGQPMLARVVHRARRATTLDRVVVATTTEPADDAIAELCVSRHWPHFRGSQTDVLDRYYHAARDHQADVVVRLTADCPLIEPEIIELALREFSAGAPLDYVSNILPPRTFPRGLDVEVVDFGALARAWYEDKNPAWREHVTPYIYRHPEAFRLRPVLSGVDNSWLRWTVDTAEDLALVRQIYEHFDHDAFSWREVLQLLEAHTEWTAMNQQVVQKEVS